MGNSRSRNEHPQLRSRPFGNPTSLDDHLQDRHGSFIAALYGCRMYSYDLETLDALSTLEIAPGDSARRYGHVQCHGVKKLSETSIVTSSVYEWSETEDSDTEPDPTFLRVYDLRAGDETVEIEIDEYITSFEPLMISPDPYLDSPPLVALNARGLRIFNVESEREVFRIEEGEEDEHPLPYSNLYCVGPWEGSLFGVDSRALFDPAINLRVTCFDCQTGSIRTQLEHSETAGSLIWRANMTSDVPSGMLIVSTPNKGFCWDPMRGPDQIGSIDFHPSANVDDIHCASDQNVIVAVGPEENQNANPSVRWVEIFDIRNLSQSLRHFQLPLPPNSSANLRPSWKLTRVSATEFATLGSESNGATLYSWDLEGKLTVSHPLNQFGFGGGWSFSGFCTVGSNYDVDTEMWRVANWFEGEASREALQERLGFLLERFCGDGEGIVCERVEVVVRREEGGTHLERSRVTTFRSLLIIGN